MQEDLQDAAACNAALDSYEAQQAPPSKRKRPPELSGDSKGDGEGKDTIVLCDSSDGEEGGDKDADAGAASQQPAGELFPAAAAALAASALAASAHGAGGAILGNRKADGSSRGVGTASAKQRQQVPASEDPFYALLFSSPFPPPSPAPSLSSPLSLRFTLPPAPPLHLHSLLPTPST